MLDIALVPTFVEVVRQGSFTKAGKELGVPKSTISRRITRLEEELHTQLLQRTTRSLRLTEVGRAYYARVAPALEALRSAEQEITEERTEIRGLLRITAPQDFAAGYLGPLVAKFTELHPAVVVSVEASTRMVDLVAEGVDLAFRGSPRLRDSTLIARKLAGGRMTLFASRTYLDALGHPTELDDLEQHRCLLFRASAGSATWTLTGREGERKVRVSGRVSSDDLAVLRSALLADGGIALLPGFLVQDDIRSGRVQRVLPAWCGPPSAMHMVYPSSRHQRAHLRAFVDFALEQLRPLDMLWSDETKGHSGA